MPRREASPAGRVILGIDPGLASTGIGVVVERPGGIVPICYDCIRTKAGEPLPDRLAIIHRKIRKLVRRFKPESVAMERLFFSKNVKTAMVVGQAQGVAMLALAGTGIEVFQYTPKDVKMAVTGSGSADKEDVALMVQKILRLEEIPRPDDAADALAIAYCHIASTRLERRLA